MFEAIFDRIREQGCVTANVEGNVGDGLELGAGSSVMWSPARSTVVVFNAIIGGRGRITSNSAPEAELDDYTRAETRLASTLPNVPQLERFAHAAIHYGVTYEFDLNEQIPHYKGQNLVLSGAGGIGVVSAYDRLVVPIEPTNGRRLAFNFIGASIRWLNVPKIVGVKIAGNVSGAMRIIVDLGTAEEAPFLADFA